MKVDVAVIGAGPAGLAAAVAAKDNGANNVIVIDREDTAGGILRQCIHSGFGLQVFGEELTGPEYAARFTDMAADRGIKIFNRTMVLEVSPGRVITAVGRNTGLLSVEASAVVLAMGCRERSVGALMTPGSRPSGVLTAGTAQYFVNIEGYLPGKEVVILGSGDVGLIMARRLTLEGAKVKMVLELMPYPGGLIRNVVQCLNDFDIPLKLSHTVTEIHGRKRIEGVTVSEVGKDLMPVNGTEEFIGCDTMLLSVGLIPENELSRWIGVMIDPATGGPIVDSDMQTSVPGVFACGNVLQVHDIADNASEEAARAGAAAAQFHDGGSKKEHYNTVAGAGVRYVVPQSILKDGADKKLFFRVSGIYKNCRISVKCAGKIISRKKCIRCAPGEMETLTLKSGDITGDVEVAVEEAQK